MKWLILEHDCCQNGLLCCTRLFNTKSNWRKKVYSRHLVTGRHKSPLQCKHTQCNRGIDLNMCSCKSVTRKQMTCQISSGPHLVQVRSCLSVWKPRPLATVTSCHCNSCHYWIPFVGVTRNSFVFSLSVCVCVREREWASERKRERDKDKECQFKCMCDWAVVRSMASWRDMTVSECKVWLK